MYHVSHGIFILVSAFFFGAGSNIRAPILVEYLQNRSGCETEHGKT